MEGPQSKENYPSLTELCVIYGGESELGVRNK